MERFSRWVLRVCGAFVGLFVALPRFAGAVDTSVLTGAASAAQKWAAAVWLELPEEIFFAPYMAEDPNSIIQLKKELEKEPGEIITFTLVRQLSGAGVTGDTAMEGAEEQMLYYSDTVTLDQVRNAVRINGKMTEKRASWNLRTAAKSVLKDWLAALIDQAIFTALSTSPSAGRVAYGGTATSTATIASGDNVTTALLSRVKTIAHKATPQMYPAKVGGKPYFLCIVSPDSLYDLTRDAEWAQAQREARERGDENPLFTGAEGITHDGIVVRSCTRVATATNWGATANIPGSDNLFLGRQAGCFAWGAKPTWVEASFDYANKVGFSIGAICGVTKAVFNAVDQGVVLVRTARSNLS